MTAIPINAVALVVRILAAGALGLIIWALSDLLRANSALQFVLTLTGYTIAFFFGSLPLLIEEAARSRIPAQSSRWSDLADILASSAAARLSRNRLVTLGISSVLLALIACGVQFAIANLLFGGADTPASMLIVAGIIGAIWFVVVYLTGARVDGLHRLEAALGRGFGYAIPTFENATTQRTLDASIIGIWQGLVAAIAHSAVQLVFGAIIGSWQLTVVVIALAAIVIIGWEFLPGWLTNLGRAQEFLSKGGVTPAPDYASAPAPAESEAFLPLPNENPAAIQSEEVPWYFRDDAGGGEPL